jgi:integrase
MAGGIWLGDGVRTPMLSEMAVRAARPAEKPYKLFDERGLFLYVTAAGGRVWRFKYRFEGREKLISFGLYPDVGLKQARDRRDDARRLLASGVDPSAKRQSEKEARADTFEAVTREWFEMKRKSLAATTHEKRQQRFETFIFPYLGNRPITSVTAPDLLATLKRVEVRGKHETAHRLRSECGQIFRYAIASGRAERDVAADLRGALAPVVVTNHAAITDPARIGELLRAIDGYRGRGLPTTETALRLAPLVFVRPGELRKARWSEFSFGAKEPEWRIPAERMKMREQHIVPLSHQAVALLRELAPLTGPDGYVFPSPRDPNRPMSENALTAALRRMGYTGDEMTWHGFRSMASTCLNEQGWSPDLIELQLAHAERDEVRGAYNRAQRLADRRKMMQAWADYLDQLRASGAVIPIRRQHGTA